jgi:hypothetical protein
VRLVEQTAFRRSRAGGNPCIKLAKDKPGALNYGSGGSGTPPHLATELFKQMAGVQMVHVPYKTIPAAITDLVGGQLQVMFTVGPAGLPQIKAGRIRGLAVSTAKRSAFAPTFPPSPNRASRATTYSAGTASSPPPAPRVPSSRSSTRFSSPA